MKNLDRAGKQWTKNEVSLLMHLVNLGLSDKDIAKKMKRTQAAVSTKLSFVRKEENTLMSYQAEKANTSVANNTALGYQAGAALEYSQAGAALQYSTVSKLQGVEGSGGENKRRQTSDVKVGKRKTKKKYGFFGRIAKALLWWK